MPPRRFLRIILPTLFALILPITTFSQSPAPRDLRAIAILQQSFAAMGGAVPVDCVATGSITIDAGGSSETGNIRILARGFNQSVEETQVSEGTFRRVYSRGRAVNKRGKRLSMEAALSSQSTVLPIQLIAQALTDPESAFEYVGVEDMDGSAVHHVRFWKTFAQNQKLHPLAPLSTKDIYIDAVSVRVGALAQDAHSLIAISSKRGVSFGVDQPEIPLDELRDQTDEKRAVFCLLFDTKCLQKQTGFERSLSYRELLVESDGLEIKTNIVRDSGVLAGTVNVFLKGAVAEKAPDMNPLEFQFFREDANWKLGAIPY